MTQIWVSWETYRRLMDVRWRMQRADGKIRTLDEVIVELIELWESRSKSVEVHNKVYIIRE